MKAAIGDHESRVRKVPSLDPAADSVERGRRRRGRHLLGEQALGKPKSHRLVRKDGAREEADRRDDRPAPDPRGGRAGEQGEREPEGVYDTSVLVRDPEPPELTDCNAAEDERCHSEERGVAGRAAPEEDEHGDRGERQEPGREVLVERAPAEPVRLEVPVVDRIAESLRLTQHVRSDAGPEDRRSRARHGHGSHDPVTPPASDETSHLPRCERLPLAPHRARPPSPPLPQRRPLSCCAPR